MLQWLSPWSLLTLMGWEMLTSVWLYFSGCRISLLRLFVCRRLMHSLRISFVCGFRGLEMNICCIINKQDLNKQFRGCYSQLKKPCSTHSSKPFFLSCYILYLCCAILQRVSQNMYTQTACALQPHVNLAHRSMNDITIIIVGMSFVLLENEHITTPCVILSCVWKPFALVVEVFIHCPWLIFSVDSSRNTEVRKFLYEELLEGKQCSLKVFNSA